MMDTIIAASAHNLDGCLAFGFVVAALISLWVIEHRSPAEKMHDTYRRHDRWN